MMSRGRSHQTAYAILSYYPEKKVKDTKKSNCTAAAYQDHQDTNGDLLGQLALPPYSARDVPCTQVKEESDNFNANRAQRWEKLKGLASTNQKNQIYF